MICLVSLTAKRSLVVAVEAESVAIEASFFTQHLKFILNLPTAFDILWKVFNIVVNCIKVGTYPIYQVPRGNSYYAQRKKVS